VALAVQSMWQTVLGAEITLESREWKYYLASRDDRRSWQVMRFAWFGDYNGASTFTDIFRSTNPQNLPSYRSEEYDRLLDEAVRAGDDDLRARLTARAERQLLDDYPIIPLYFFVSKHLVSPQVENFLDNVLDRHPSQYLHKNIQAD
jgi:oligopeptide transport system substrate-binding protein